MGAKIKLDDLPLELQNVLGKKIAKTEGRSTRKQQTSIETIRRSAINALGAISTLSTSDRERSLKLAIKMNKS